MTSREMDLKLGYNNRMAKVGNNLKKFGMIEGQVAKLQIYHTDMINDGLDMIAEQGVRNYCDERGKLNGISGASIKSDYAIMKRYKIIK